MVHGLEGIKEINETTIKWEALARAGIVKPDVPRRLTEEEMEELKELQKGIRINLDLCRACEDSP